MIDESILYPESPLIVNPALAEMIGLEEAILIQQIHYWLQRSDVEVDGFKWVYNTYDQWALQFPFWDRQKVQRIILRLEQRDLIISMQKKEYNRKKYYRINFASYDANSTDATYQKATMERIKCRPSKVSKTVDVHTENTTKTSTKINAGEILNYFSFRKIEEGLMDAGREYILTSAIMGQIHGRIRDGFSLDDFKYVIDNRIAHWRSDDKMREYIRPSTIFSAKNFPNYLASKMPDEYKEQSWADRKRKK